MAKAMGKSSAKTSAAKKSMTTTQEAVDEKYLCYGCGKKQKRSEFYSSTDPFNTVGIIPYCKNCLEKIARNYNNNYKQFGDVTKASLMAACERADVPYLETLWEASLNEVNNPNLKKPKTNVWAAYIKNVKLPNYNGMRWRDGDLFQENRVVNGQVDDNSDVYIAPDVAEELERNRKDVVRLIGYDPFEKEQDDDKPLLYAQTVGYLDMSGNNDDMMRTSSVITIVRGYLQLQKLDDMIAKSMRNAANTGNSGEIKAYLDSKAKISSTISQLAEQSCISLKHNKNSTKGENTWTGKVRIMKEMNLREAEVNVFDAETAGGLAQVADISNASILKQINLDENDYVQMLSEQKRMIEKLTKEANEAIEKSRILLRENIDLKKLLEDKGIDISENLSRDTILYEEGDGGINE
jgi:hypothetical protein